MKVAPSLLACDFSRMGEEIIKIDKAGADLVHLDVMDGMFVPNFTMGPAAISALRKYTTLPFDVHLMIEHPFDYIDTFADSGADIITFHIESASDTEKTIDKIISRGVKPGLVIKPYTPAGAVFPYLEKLYMVLVMTVEPGFGGQPFMPNMLNKVKVIKEECQRRGLDIVVEVDGGVSEKNAGLCAEAGVDICVSGSCIFKSANMAETIAKLKVNN
ncbi:MAG: ribulose-phosphate 3-epimerase [Clostridia bacterium]|nr:ribulose-phosphate 3-epimerase [Clostridia bacterium]